MSLLQDPPASSSSRPDLRKYLLPGLVLVNLLLMASLAGWLPVVFGDHPDPGRLNRQIDAERVRVVPSAVQPMPAETTGTQTP
ncbi:MAG: hypothetical protein Q4D19_04505 [Lautropia sp.]|nr:hypothetical protein [Lautropia sp.]